MLLSLLVCSTDLEDQREELRQRRAEIEERSASSARDMRAADPCLRSVFLFALIAVIAVSLCQMSSCFVTRVAAGKDQAQGSHSSSRCIKPYVPCVACRTTLSLYAHISRIIWSDQKPNEIAGKVSDPEQQDVRSFNLDTSTLSHFDAVNRLWDVIT